ncbi:RNA-binding domain-containing protein [Candidatus Hydrogenedentota bacterium]
MIKRIAYLLDQGEGIAVEFKTARMALNRDVYETVCAFLNRSGGDLLLGVGDDGDVVGIDANHIERMRKEFVTTINNPQKLSPPCYLSVETVDFHGKMLLHVLVPQSSQVHRCNGKIFDRNEDGDFDITDNQTLTTQLYVRKQSHYSENTIYPYAELADLRPELIDRARKLAENRQPVHPWTSMDDMELLTSAQLWLQDYQRNVRGLTLAGILLFGTDTTILSILPHHRTDALLRRDDINRYDDRDDIRTNLLDSHTRLIAFGEKHLKDPFYLEGEQRVSLRNRILREIVGNLLIHREYSHAFPAKMVIERERLFTENSNKPHGHGLIDPNLFSPYPKNPAIARVFKEIGWADELGSGVRNLFKYCHAFGGHDPELIEDDIFRLNLPLSEMSRAAAQEKPFDKTPVKTPVETLVKTPGQIIQVLAENPEMTLAGVAEIIGKSLSAVERATSKLVKEGRIRHVGPKKGGHWEVTP